MDENRIYGSNIRCESKRIMQRLRIRADILTARIVIVMVIMTYFGILGVRTWPDVGLEVVARLPEVGSSSDILGDALGAASPT